MLSRTLVRSLRLKPIYPSLTKLAIRQYTTKPDEPEQPPKFDPRTLINEGIPSVSPEKLTEEFSKRDDSSIGETALAKLERKQKRQDRDKRQQYVSSADRKRERLANIMFMTFLAGCVGSVVYLGRNWETDEEESRYGKEAPNGWGPLLFYHRVRMRLHGVLDYYNLPNAEKLLPEQPPEIFRPYTLVISLEDMLVHSEWTRESGWRTAKRPGVDYFLTYLSQYYEIVIFTSSPSVMAGPIISKLDPYRGCHQLYRESTKYKNGKYIKDLSYLGRDLSKVILIDTKEASWSAQPENAIKMKPWKGNANDKSLVALIPLLEFIASMGHNDVREVLASFPEGVDIPTEFARREAKARAEFHRRVEEDRRTRKKTGAEWLLAALGIGTQHHQEKMIQDQVRERGRQNYEEMARNIKEHGAEYLEMDRKAQEEMMAQMKTSLSRIFTEGMPQPQMSKEMQQQQEATINSINEKNRRGH